MIKNNKLLIKAESLLLSLALFAPYVLSNAPAVSAEEAEVSPLTPTEIELVESIDTDFILEIEEYVHNNIGPRVAGTPADEASAEYFASLFEELGYEPFTYATGIDGIDDYFETITNNTTVNNRIGGSITIDGREYTALAPGWSDDSVYKGYQTESIAGQTVYFETVEEALAADPSEISGKIVITNSYKIDVEEEVRGQLQTSSKEITAVSAEWTEIARTLEDEGALALVFLHSKYTVSDEGQVSSERKDVLATPTTGEDIDIPVILVPYLDGRSIVKSLTDDNGNVESATATVVNRRNTHTSNILAIKYSETPSDKYVMVGAHRDSVIGAEGANDNLSGVVDVFAIAKALQDIPTEYNVVFALWAAEEDGLVGSKYFYSEVLAPDGWGVDHFIAYYNLDMAATSQTRNSVLTIHTPYYETAEDGTKIPLQSLAGDVAETQAERYWIYTDGEFSDWWTQGPDDYVDIQYFGNCSDHASITGANAAEKLAFGEGIPSVYIFWGDRIGDDINYVTEQNYHVPGDIYEWPEDEDQFIVVSDSEYFTGNFSIERAQILASVYALSVYNTAAIPVDSIEDGETYYGDTTIDVTYNYRDNVIVDGEAVTLTDGAYTIAADNAEHTVVLTDLFGNTATYTFGVYETYTVTFVADGTVVDEKTVNYGDTLTDIPEVPAKDGYDETAPVWDVTDFTNITSDLTVNAVYTTNPVLPNNEEDNSAVDNEDDNNAADDNPLNTGDRSFPSIYLVFLMIPSLAVSAVLLKKAWTQKAPKKN